VVLCLNGWVSKFLDLSWLSDVIHEKEMLFFGGTRALTVSRAVDERFGFDHKLVLAAKRHIPRLFCVEFEEVDAADENAREAERARKAREAEQQRIAAERLRRQRQNEAAAKAKVEQATRDQAKQTMIQSLRDMGYAFDEALRAWTSVPPSQRGDKLALIAFLKNETAQKSEATESAESKPPTATETESVEMAVDAAKMRVNSEEKSAAESKESKSMNLKVAKSEELQADTKDMLRKLLLRQLHKFEAESNGSRFEDALGRDGVPKAVDLELDEFFGRTAHVRLDYAAMYNHKTFGSLSSLFMTATRVFCRLDVLQTLFPTMSVLSVVGVPLTTLTFWYLKSEFARAAENESEEKDDVKDGVDGDGDEDGVVLRVIRFVEPRTEALTIAQVIEAEQRSLAAMRWKIHSPHGRLLVLEYSTAEVVIAEEAEKKKEEKEKDEAVPGAGRKKVVKRIVKKKIVKKVVRKKSQKKVAEVVEEGAEEANQANTASEGQPPQQEK